MGWMRVRVALCDVNGGGGDCAGYEGKKGASDRPGEENPVKEKYNGDVQIIADGSAAGGDRGRDQGGYTSGSHGVWPGKGSTVSAGVSREQGQPPKYSHRACEVSGSGRSSPLSSRLGDSKEYREGA